MRTPGLAAATAVAIGCLTASADGADWPGWRGADRTGVSKEKGLLHSWPTGGPSLAWKAKGLGSGYSTPSVAGGRIYVMGGRDQKEFLFALSVENGEKVWETPVGAVASVGYAGPRATPTVDGENIYVLGSSGDLACITTAGKSSWTKNIKEDFGGRYGAWGYSESPLADGDLLICTPGGGDASIVALNKTTGETIWKSAISGGNDAAYSSPIIAMAGKTKQYVTFLSGALVGVDAKTGKQAWSYKKSANGTANIPTAIYKDGFVFSASGYGTGGGLVKIGPKKADQVYFSSEMVNHHGGLVLIGKHLYGTNEQSLLCLDFKTGAKAWQNRSVGKGSITAADGLLFVRSEGGPVALVEASPKGYKELGRFEQPDRSNEPAWPHPVIADGRLYLRDQDLLLAYDVKAK